MSFSIVIPTSGRISDLDACLSSLQECIRGSEDFDVFVVDNNIDKTFSAAVHDLCRGRYLFELSCFTEEKPGLTAARHKGLELSRADIICYVDDDVIFTPQWFDSVRLAFVDSSVALAGGPTLPRFTSSVPPWFWDFVIPTPYGGWCCEWLSLLDIGEDIDQIHPNWIWGLNFSIRRDVLLECGGFHVDLVPKQYMRWQGDGETGLTMKIAEKGYKAVYRHNSLLFHHCGVDRLNAEYFVKRAYFQGVCNSFAALRRQSSSNALPDTRSVMQDLKTKLRQNASCLKKRLLDLSLPEVARTPWSAASSEIKVRCQEAEQMGYAFHQSEALRNTSLQEWIKRPNFFDTDLRDFPEA